MVSRFRISRVLIGVGATVVASFVLLALMALLNLHGRSARAAQGALVGSTEVTLESAKWLTPPLVLNEVMVNNHSVISDEAGDFDNWVEVYNAGPLPFDVGGMALSNGTLSPTQWLIPAGTVIPGRGYLLIWVDGEPFEGSTHTDFALVAGQTISLLDKAAFDWALVDRLSVLNTAPDWSRARHPNGDGAWVLFDHPSPGALNATNWVYLPLVARGSSQTEKRVFINELMAANDNTIADEANEYDDWIELYNAGPDDVDLGGMYLSDDLGNLPRWQIPLSTVITAGGHLLFWADDQAAQGPLHTNFRLSRDGEVALLVDADGYTLLDQITFSAQQDDVSLGRLPDGADNWQNFSVPTPGGPNSPNPIDIAGTMHWPTVVSISDTVTVTARIAASYPPLTVTLFHDAANGVTQTLMLDDGAHGDGASGDGVYGAQIPSQSAYRIVHYYIQVRDGLGWTATDPAGAPDHTYVYAVDLPLGTLVINEFMASNSSGITDEVGEFEDWIELHNAGSITLDVGGFYLTDDLDEPTRWQFPPGAVLSPGGFLLVWADNEPEEGVYHASFKLSANGETIGLLGPDGVVAVDVLTYSAQIQDVSLGRYPDGADDWLPMILPTPGYANALPTYPLISDVMHMPSVPGPGVGVTVTARITDDGAVVSATLNYDTGSGFTPTLMWDDGDHGDGGPGDGVFGGRIPAQPDRAVVYYFIQAHDDQGYTSTIPLPASDLPYRYVVGGGGLPLYINEFMASNNTVISDTAGEFDDWIELYNAGPTPVRLGGMYLSDDLANDTLWQIPHGLIVPPGGFILFWADRDINQGDRHADFKLSASGEDVALFDAPLYGNALIDGLEGYPSQATDKSYGRSGDGGPTWRTFTTPTPEESNPL